MASPLIDDQLHRPPGPPEPLIGREVETATVVELLRRTDVLEVTLTGPGGVGKTRLAQHIASICRNFFVHGVIFVSLASIRDPSLVMPAVAQAFGLRDLSGPRLQNHLCAAVAGRRMLLVLDNFEQVALAATELAELVTLCPTLTILVTSRSRLHVSCENVYPLSPFKVPNPTDIQSFDNLAQSDSVRLFVARAQAASPDFVLTEENGSAVADVCSHLDGLPLAIELAAARSNVLPPVAMRDRLEPRLPMLTGGGRDIARRQQTMESTIAWSYGLLSPEEQRFFRVMSVFAGGFAWEHADKIWGAMLHSQLDTISGISSLVDKSLLQSMNGIDSEPRYVMLETIREFGMQHLALCDELNEVQRHHSEWFVALAEMMEPRLWQPDQATALSELDAERDNFRAALVWAIDHNAELGLRLASALWLFWYIQGHLTEGRRWLEKALTVGVVASRDVRAKALNNLGNLLYELGELPQAQSLYEHSLVLRKELDDQVGIADVLNNLGMLATARGDYARADRLLRSSLDLREQDDPYGLAPTMNNLGDVAIAQGNFANAQLWNVQALGIGRETGNIRRIAHSLHNLGNVARGRGEYKAADTLFQESLELFSKVDDKSGSVTVLHSLGRLTSHQANITQATTYYTDALQLHQTLLDRRGMVQCLEGIALIAESKGCFEDCVRLLSAAAVMRGPMVALLLPMDRDASSALEERMRTRLGEAEFMALWTAGSALSTSEILEEATRIAAAPSAKETCLTSRENEVLHLMASGYSNKEIADTLFISVRTVKAHVTSILAKLELPSRSAATAYAHQNELF